MPFGANGYVFMLRNATSYENILIESDKSVNVCQFNKMSVFHVNKFEVISSGNNRRRVFLSPGEG